LELGILIIDPQLTWATFYGGNGADGPMSIDTDNNGNVFVAGYTASGNFPTQNPGGGACFQGTNAGTVDAFILKSNNAGVLLWATYYGGRGDEYFSSDHNLAIDNCGNVYMGFQTASSDIPVQSSCDAGYFDNSFGGAYDQFIAFFSNTGILRWATYLGGDGFDARTPIVVDANNNLFVSGEWINVTSNATYPLTDPGGGAYYDATFNGGGHDGFIAKFSPVPIVANTTVTQANCSNPCGGSATANVVSPSACSYSYLWSNGQTFQTVTGLCAGNYTVTLTNQLCKDTFLIVILNNNSGLILNPTNTPANCGSNNGTATVNTTGGTNPFTYSWNNGQTTSTATALAAGTYTATVTDGTGCSNTQTVTETSTNTDANGCIKTQTVNISQTAGPIVTASTSLNIISVGSNATLTATGGGTYQWSPSTGLSCITCASPTASPSTKTIYCVTVTDTAGCSGSACVTVLVDVDCSERGELYLPNAFSPNNDGENDLLEIYYGDKACIKNFKIFIYNRWGEKVFSATGGPASGGESVYWDGIYKGKPEGTAVFVYYLEVNLISGEDIVRKGNITLMR